MGKPILTNSQIAELLALESEMMVESPTKTKALRRASAAALMWPDEAADLLRQNRSLTELNGVGPYISEVIRRWIDQPPEEQTNSEFRKNFLTLSEARAILGKNPKWKKSYKGDLQMHTLWSDGSGTVQAMADAAIERGYEYIGITDHSKGLKIAGGIDESALARQGKEIEAVNSTLRRAGHSFTVLKSIEMNLNPLGQGDMDAKALKTLDLVVGSFHSVLRKTEDQTSRYLAALNNPSIHILGHPRGRVYNYRIGLKADWKKVFDHATKLNKAVEIDSYPDRQDLDGELLKLAKKSGCKIAIDTDAHHPWQLGFIELGLASALQAGIKAQNIINFWDATSLGEWSKSLGANRSQ